MRTLFFLYVILVGGCVSEPHCSKFHYEEKLLEKMIRTEILVKKMKQEMDAIQSTVKESLAKLREEINKWKTEMETMRQKGETELTALQEKANSELEKNIKLVDSLKDKISTPSVAFSAKQARDVNPGTGNIILFTETLVNLGESYSTDTGIFTAPYGGTYIFDVQLCIDGVKMLDHGIVVNDSYMNIARYNDNYSRVTCGTSAATVALKPGDNVWVKAISQSSGTILYNSGKNYWNTFSGTLIHAD